MALTSGKPQGGMGRPESERFWYSSQCEAEYVRGFIMYRATLCFLIGI